MHCLVSFGHNGFIHAPPYQAGGFMSNSLWGDSPNGGSRAISRQFPGKFWANGGPPFIFFPGSLFCETPLSIAQDTQGAVEDQTVHAGRLCARALVKNDESPTTLSEPHFHSGSCTLLMLGFTALTQEAVKYTMGGHGVFSSLMCD